MYDEFKEPGGTCMLNLHIFLGLKKQCGRTDL